MEYIKKNSTQITTHEFKEEEREQKLIGCLTNIYPNLANSKHATKIISQLIKIPKERQKPPKFRIKSALKRTNHQGINVNVRTYRIKVNKQESSAMLVIVKKILFQ
jgi:hypothetical protein